jgi:hypothetical protein
MADVSNELIYTLMLDIQAGQEALTHKVGTVATALLSMSKRLDDLDGSMNVFSRRQQELTNTTQLIAVAVDDHTHRLDKIEVRLDRIEKKLDLTHA